MVEPGLDLLQLLLGVVGQLLPFFPLLLVLRPRQSIDLEAIDFGDVVGGDVGTGGQVWKDLVEADSTMRRMLGKEQPK